MRLSVEGLRSPDHPETCDRVLVVEGQPCERTDQLACLLAAQGCAVTLTALETAVETEVQSYLLAILQPGPNEAAGLDRLRRLRNQAPSLRVALVGAPGSVAGAVEAMRAQAFDYLEDPVSPAALQATVRRARMEPDPRQAAWLECLQALTPGLVHELRNPLSGILAGSQLLVRLLQGQEKAVEYAGIIQEEAQQLKGFLTRLAEFGRLRSQGAEVAAQLDFPGLLTRLLDEILPASQARDVRIVTSYQSGVSPVRGDPGQLGLACTEILRNAQEAMPEGGTLTVTTRLMAGNGGQGAGGTGSSHRKRERNTAHEVAWIEVAFWDTGSGLTDEARSRAFEPFFSTRPRALGIGLTLAQAVVRAHGGTIQLVQNEAGGACARMRLPAEISEAA